MPDASRPRGGFGRLLGASVVSNLGDGVGVVAYPWLASVVTRRPLLVALVTVAQRLPWLLITLPAGVVTDRLDRRRLMVWTDLVRGWVTATLAAFVFLRIEGSPDPADTVGTDAPLYLAILLATVVVGCAEVLHDNAGQTIVPALVPVPELERANGRLWVGELVANTFAGPPLGSLLLTVGLALAISADAVSFLVAAVLLVSLPGTFRPVASPGAAPAERRSWWAEAREGLRWLWHHDLLRPLAVTLGCMNLASTISLSSLVLYAQEVLDCGPLQFAALAMAGALGGVVAGIVAPGVSSALGPGRALVVTIAGCSAGALVVGVAPSWPIAAAAFGVTGFLGTLWNVITVSLRQAIIPDALLGRVNSVYRLIAWGLMPVGALIGAGLIVGISQVAARTTALRATWFAEAAVYFALLLVVPARLTTARMEAARATARR